VAKFPIVPKNNLARTEFKSVVCIIALPEKRKISNGNCRANDLKFSLSKK